ncbi:MAG: GlsB/YeaQ/YmgE family stress response membrane protein [Burkholderiaceae bacterium]
MNLIWTAIIGLVIGAVAKFIMPGRQGGGIIVTALLGIVGSFVATYVGQALGFYPQGSEAGFIASVIGAIVVLWIYGKIRAKSAA